MTLRRHRLIERVKNSKHSILQIKSDSIELKRDIATYQNDMSSRIQVKMGLLRINNILNNLS